MVIQLAALLGRKAAGFFTVQLREKDKRVGFEAVTMQGRRETLAHIEFPGPYRKSLPIEIYRKLTRSGQPI